MVGADGQLPVAAVDQHGQPHDARAAEVDDGVQGGADGAAGVEDVVDQHHGLAVDAGARQLGGDGGRVGWCERSSRYMVTSSWPTMAAASTVGSAAAIFCGEALGQRVAAAGDAQQDQVLGALVGLEDLMGDTSEGTVNVGLVEDNPSPWPEPVLL